jgi:hypothetical protein
MRPRAILVAFFAFAAALSAPGLTLPVASAVAAETPPDAIAALAAEIKAGGKPLVFTAPVKGYVPDLLRRLKVQADSQVLVFSRTSLQQGFIGPASPRAIYFNDTVSIGYIPGAPLIEMWAVGRDGAVRFYTLKNTPTARLQIQSEDAGDDCRICHAASNPAAPGPMVMSVSTLSSGVVSIYDRQTDARTPIAQRWGGWYVTGLHGDMRHRGNLVSDATGPDAGDKGQNLTSLAGRFEFARYFRPTSDIVALMTLEHETGFLNLAGEVQSLSKADPDSAAVDKAVGDLADYMLGVDGAALTAQVKGGSGFSERFAAQGLKDAKGRGLRDFDLRSRLFRYPLSYMIYTPAFDALPSAAKTKLYRRLADVLTGQDASAKYRVLSQVDRTAAFDILAATKPGLPTYWRAAA